MEKRRNDEKARNKPKEGWTKPGRLRCAVFAAVLSISLALACSNHACAGTDPPLTQIVVAIDESQSMSLKRISNDPEEKRYDALYDLLVCCYSAEQLRGIEVGLLPFANEPFGLGEGLVDITSHKFLLDRFDSIIGNIKSVPGKQRWTTNMSLALERALQMFSPQAGKRIVLLLSDGIDTCYVEDNSRNRVIAQTPECTKTRNLFSNEKSLIPGTKLADIYDACKRQGVELWPIIINKQSVGISHGELSEESKNGIELMRQLAFPKSDVNPTLLLPEKDLRDVFLQGFLRDDILGGKHAPHNESNEARFSIMGSHYSVFIQSDDVRYIEISGYSGLIQIDNPPRWLEFKKFQWRGKKRYVFYRPELTDFDNLRKWQGDWTLLGKDKKPVSYVESGKTKIIVFNDMALSGNMPRRWLQYNVPVLDFNIEDVISKGSWRTIWGQAKARGALTQSADSAPGSIRWKDLDIDESEMRVSGTIDDDVFLNQGKYFAHVQIYLQHGTDDIVLVHDEVELTVDPAPPLQGRYFIGNTEYPIWISPDESVRPGEIDNVRVAVNVPEDAIVEIEDLENLDPPDPEQLRPSADNPELRKMTFKVKENARGRLRASVKVKPTRDRDKPDNYYPNVINIPYGGTPLPRISNLIWSIKGPVTYYLGEHDKVGVTVEIRDGDIDERHVIANHPPLLRIDGPQVAVSQMKLEPDSEPGRSVLHFQKSTFSKEFLRLIPGNYEVKLDFTDPVKQIVAQERIVDLPPKKLVIMDIPFDVKIRRSVDKKEMSRLLKGIRTLETGTPYIVSAIPKGDASHLRLESIAIREDGNGRDGNREFDSNGETEAFDFNQEKFVSLFIKFADNSGKTHVLPITEEVRVVWSDIKAEFELEAPEKTFVAGEQIEFAGYVKVHGGDENARHEHLRKIREALETLQNTRGVYLVNEINEKIYLEDHKIENDGGRNNHLYKVIFVFPKTGIGRWTLVFDRWRPLGKRVVPSIHNFAFSSVAFAAGSPSEDRLDRQSAVLRLEELVEIPKDLQIVVEAPKWHYVFLCLGLVGFCIGGFGLFDWFATFTRKGSLVAIQDRDVTKNRHVIMPKPFLALQIKARAKGETVALYVNGKKSDQVPSSDFQGHFWISLAILAVFTVATIAYAYIVRSGAIGLDLAIGGLALIGASFLFVWWRHYRFPYVASDILSGRKGFYFSFMKLPKGGMLYLCRPGPGDKIGNGFYWGIWKEKLLVRNQKFYEQKEDPCPKVTPLDKAQWHLIDSPIKIQRTLSKGTFDLV